MSTVIAPTPASDVMTVATVCREIHNFRALKYYGRLVADPDEVLNWVQ